MRFPGLTSGTRRILYPWTAAVTDDEGPKGPSTSRGCPPEQGWLLLLPLRSDACEPEKEEGTLSRVGRDVCATREMRLTSEA